MRLPATVCLCLFVTLAGMSAAPAQNAAQIKRDLAACDNGKDMNVRIAGCTRAMSSFKWPAKARAILLVQRGQGYAQKTELESALADFDRALAADRNSMLAYAERANVYRLLGEYDKAINDATEAIRRDPKYGQAYLNRGDSYYRKNDFERAAADFESMIRLGSANAVKGYLGRALVWLREKRPDEAIAAIDSAIKIDAKSAQAYALRCSAWQDKKEFRNAVADCNRLVALAPASSAAYHDRGVAHFSAGQHDEALADFDRAIKLDANNAGAYSRRGDVRRAKNDLTGALADFGHAIYVRPSVASVYVLRGQTYEANGDLQRAQADYESALKLPAQIIVRGAQGIYTEDSYREQQTARARLSLLTGASATPPPDPSAKSGFAPSSPDAGRRVALVIGNGSYINTSILANPAKDAAVISKNLRAMGFEVSEGIDLDRAAMQGLLGDFLLRASSAHLALLFYAGHGIQIDGKNFLLPVDARLDNPSELAGSVTDVDTILAALDDRIRANIVILDACRDNPLAEKVQQAASASATRSVSVRSGLAAPTGLHAGATLGAGTLLAFATAPGQVALDGDGENSPFSSALARHIGTPGLEVQQMLTRVRAEVVAATRNKQVPWSNSSLLGEVYLVGGRPR